MSSLHYGRGTGSGSHVPARNVPESTTSAFSTTSYDSRSEEGLDRDRAYSEARERTYSDRDATKDTSYSQRDATFNSGKDVTFRSKLGDTSTDTDRHGSYDFFYPPYEKTEWSCDEAGGWQKLSFLFLVITFIGHAIAVCTPYWVVGYMGDQMTLYEGIWLSCYREQGVGSWVCSTYDTIRNLFEQPVWYQASQICAVLSVILLMPALVGATLYSYVVSLSGRSRASWVLVGFLGVVALCSFLSFVVFAAGYPTNQKFPPGDVRFHISFALQIISFLFCLLSLATHVRDAYATLTVWDHNKISTRNGFPSARSGGPAFIGRPGGIEMPRNTASKAPNSSASKSSAPKLGSFSFPKFPSALSRFRSKREVPSAPPATDRRDEVVREPTAERVQTLPVHGGGAPSQRPSASKPTSYRSYAPSSDSMSGYDSQV